MRIDGADGNIWVDEGERGRERGQVPFGWCIETRDSLLNCEREFFKVDTNRPMVASTGPVSCSCAADQETATDGRSRVPLTAPSPQGND